MYVSNRVKFYMYNGEVALFRGNRLGDLYNRNFEWF